MKGFWIVALVVLTSSCKEVTFKTPQPNDKRALLSVPASLQGKYLTYTGEGKLSKDTVVITAKGYRFGYFDAAERSVKNRQYEEGVISDSLVLKSYKGYYFVSINEHPEWILRVIHQQNNGDLIYMAFEDKTMDFNHYLKKLSAEIRIDSLKREEETLYQIEPSANQLVQLIKKGYVSSVKLKKIN